MGWVDCCVSYLLLLCVLIFFFVFLYFLVEIMKFKIYKVNYKVLLIDIEIFS